jgi:glucose dehydrogenase
MKTGRPQVVRSTRTAQNGADVNTKGICPAALGSKDQQPASYDPKTGCSTCRPTTSAWTTSRSRSNTPPASRMSARRCRCIPAPGSHGGMGNFIAWDAGTGKIVLVQGREVLGLERRAVTAGGMSSTARWKAT